MTARVQRELYPNEASLMQTRLMRVNKNAMCEHSHCDTKSLQIDAMLKIRTSVVGNHSIIGIPNEEMRYVYFIRFKK